MLYRLLRQKLPRRAAEQFGQFVQVLGIIFSAVFCAFYMTDKACGQVKVNGDVLLRKAILHPDGPYPGDNIFIDFTSWCLLSHPLSQGMERII